MLDILLLLVVLLLVLMRLLMVLPLLAGLLLLVLLLRLMLPEEEEDVDALGDELPDIETDDECELPEMLDDVLDTPKLVITCREVIE